MAVEFAVRKLLHEDEVWQGLGAGGWEVCRKEYFSFDRDQHGDAGIEVDGTVHM